MAHSNPVKFNGVKLYVDWTAASTRANILTGSKSGDVDGEPLATSMGKIAKWYTDFKVLTFTDLSISNGTAETGKAITALSYNTSTGVISVTKGTFLTQHPTITTDTDTTSTASPSHGETFTAIDSVTRDTNGHVKKVNTKTVTLPAQYSHPTYTRSNTTSTASPAHGGTFTVIDSITSNTLGHVTAVNTKTITLPADSNTDTKVTQTNTTTDASYRLLFSENANDTTETTTARKSTTLQFNPTSGLLTTKDITMYNSSNGETPGIIFRRGTFTDTYNDWKIWDEGGKLYFGQRGSNSTAFDKLIYFGNSGNINAVSFIGGYGSFTSDTFGSALNIIRNSTDTGSYSAIKYSRKTTVLGYIGFKEQDGSAYRINGSNTLNQYAICDANNTTFTRSLSSGTKIGTLKIAGGTAVDLYCETDTWEPLTGATSSENGTVGYINAAPPSDGYNTKYFRADGTWAVPPGTYVHPTYTRNDTTSTTSNLEFNVIDSVTTNNGHVTAVNVKTVSLSDNDTKNTAGSTDTSSKIFLVGATSQTTYAQTYSDDQCYVTNGAFQARVVSASGGVNANTANSQTAGGLSLYGTDPSTYGIMFRSTSSRGKHGYVQSDWATYFTMNNSATRGWVFYSQANVASVSGAGNAVFNGSVTVGGNTTNTSGCRMTYNSTTESLDFVFAS